MRATEIATKGQFDDLVAKVDTKLEHAKQRGELIIEQAQFPLRHFPDWGSGWIGSMLGGVVGLAQMFGERLAATVGMTRQLASEPGRPWTLVEAGEQWIGKVGNPTDGMIGIMTPQQLGSSSWSGSAGPVFNATLPAQQNALGAFHGISQRINDTLTDAAGTIEEFWKTVAQLATKLSTDFFFILMLGGGPLRIQFGGGYEHSFGWQPNCEALHLALRSLEQYTGRLYEAVQTFWSGMDATTAALTELAADDTSFYGGKWPSPNHQPHHVTGEAQ